MSTELTEKPTHNDPIPADALKQILTEARTYNDFSDRPVSEETLKTLYNTLRMGPTSANSSPARFLFISSADAKARLEPSLSEGNRAKTMAAPVTVVLAWDTEFYEKVPQLMPHNPGAREWFTAPESTLANGKRNSVLQAAYLIIAARALGLDTGAMTGFDPAKLDAEFFANDQDMKTWKSDILINLGYGTTKNLFPRLPRLDFDEAAKIL
ncbi:malonic semialdehyde reductase [Maricaulis parjimensis]|uniref:malonic semialdehyde reductase n=1 Tax=Maricaulis parjimensis TaxID=144023 RepID=UPI00193A5A5D|nr:malonic semialdehyde reductase [Maricaulis parjimensis]